MRIDFAVLLGILAVALGSMPVYALTAYGRLDPHESSSRGSFVLGNFVRSWFYWFIRPVERISLALGLSPLFYNLLGVAFGMTAGVLFGVGRVNLAGWAVLMGGVADVLDGRIARARGLVDSRGAFLDSTLDRFAEFGAFVGLAVLFKDSVTSLVLVVVALGGSLLVSYARARGESQGVLCNKGVMQRAERMLLLGFGAILDPPVSELLGREPGAVLVPVLAIIALGTVGTAIYRTVWIARELGNRKSD